MCKRVGVPMEQMDKEMNLPKKLIGDDIYKHILCECPGDYWRVYQLNTGRCVATRGHNQGMLQHTLEATLTMSILPSMSRHMH
ncbi:hypothetical protein Gotur_033523 [Gossypium turneri]